MHCPTHVGWQYGLFPVVYLELNLSSKSSIKGIHIFIPVLESGGDMFREDHHPKSCCKASSRKGDVGVNEGNGRPYNLDGDRRWKGVKLGVKREGKARTS
jgi:hypothetical protein